MSSGVGDAAVLGGSGELPSCVCVGSCLTGLLVENCLMELGLHSRAAAVAGAAGSAEGAWMRRRRNGWVVGLLRGSKRAS